MSELNHTPRQSGRQDLLFEVGMAEVPARFLPGMVAQLKERSLAALRAARLTWESAACYGAPRRVAIVVCGLDERQADQEHAVRGPAAKAAFGPDGQPTGAALGFARSQGVDPSALYRREHTPGNEYVFVRKVEVGRPTALILPQLLAGVLSELQFARNMRWGSYEYEFVRPIRWLLALYGDEPLRVELAGLPATLNEPPGASRGHRFLAPGPLAVETPARYLDALRAACVIADPAERRELITSGAAQLGTTAGGTVELSPSLVTELVWLAEHPVPVLGSFDAGYLDLPDAVLVTVMQHHQRFLALRAADDRGRLLASFVGIRDGGEEHLDTVRAGYEAVLRARLADARFFYDEDCKRPLTDRLPELEGIVYHPKLGTIGAKTRRLTSLAAALGAAMPGVTDAEQAAACRAAHLAKCDLTTQMVRELPELQGVMGGEYARLAGEDRAVAAAIAEQYLPAGEGSAMPATVPGLLLAVADKLDALLGYYAAGVRPTGSQDPHGLRRAAHGVVTALIASGRRLGLRRGVAAAAAAYAAENGFAESELAAATQGVLSLLKARLEAALAEEGFEYDEIAAAVAPVGLELDPTAIAQAGRALRRVRREAWFRDVCAAAVRAAGLGARAAVDLAAPAATDPAASLAAARSAVPVPDPALFCEAPEAGLYEACQMVLAGEDKAAGERPAQDSDTGAPARTLAQGDYIGYWRSLAPLRQPIDAFFDGVLVMAPEETLKRNRLALCYLAHAAFAAAGDLSRLVWPQREQQAEPEAGANGCTRAPA